MPSEIPEKTLEGFRQWYHQYSLSFESPDPLITKNIRLKHTHSLRVREEALWIGRQIGMDEADLRIAETVALFHDIGRFDQYTRFKTYVDRKNINHALHGLDILDQEGTLEVLDSATREVVRFAIGHHNVAELPVIEDSEQRKHARLIRDADKLDIWRVVTDHYHTPNAGRDPAIELDLPDTPGISRAPLEDLVARKIVDLAHMKNLNDFKLLQVGWAFDLNFAPTFQRLLERQYLQKIRAVLPNNHPTMSSVVVDVIRYAQAKAEGGSKPEADNQ